MIEGAAGQKEASVDMVSRLPDHVQLWKMFVPDIHGSLKTVDDDCSTLIGLHSLRILISSLYRTVRPTRGSRSRSMWSMLPQLPSYTSRLHACN
jgi:hypothetical protein